MKRKAKVVKAKVVRDPRGVMFAIWSREDDEAFKPIDAVRIVHEARYRELLAAERRALAAPVDPWRVYLLETRAKAAGVDSIGASVAVALLDDLLARGPK